MHSTRNLKIGWLFPYSGIFRNLKSDLERGLQLALSEKGSDLSITSCYEFIQTGGQKPTEDALKKLWQFENVDLVVGVLSSKVALNILPLVDASRTPMIFLNLGADIPLPAMHSDYLFYNSLHLWKSQWVLGKWAQQQFGGEPSINMSVYEGGYGLHESFKAGTAVSGAETIKLNIIQGTPTGPDTTPLIEYIRTQQPRHAHILLSGKEGQHFLSLFQESGLSDRLSLTVNPFLVDGEGPASLTSGKELYSALTWSSQSDTIGNRDFLQHYSSAFEEAPRAFSLLAYETGLALTAAIQGLPGQLSRDNLAAALRETSIISPRGTINLSTRPLQTGMPVYILQTIHDPQTGQPATRIVEECTGVEWNNPALSNEQAYLTGWQNPYLCV